MQQRFRLLKWLDALLRSAVERCHAIRQTEAIILVGYSDAQRAMISLPSFSIKAAKSKTASLFMMRRWPIEY